MERDKFIILLASTVIAAFVGAFAASFMINLGGRPAKPYFFPHMVERPLHSDLDPGFGGGMEQNEKMLEDQEKMLDKLDDSLENSMEEGIEHAARHGGFFFMRTSGLKTQETKDLYRIIVDLKPFNNDMKNVDVRVKGKNITISAKYKSKNKNEFSSSQFYQTLTLPMKINVDAVKKQKQGDSLVILVPKK